MARKLKYRRDLRKWRNKTGKHHANRDRRNRKVRFVVIEVCLYNKARVET